MEDLYPTRGDNSGVIRRKDPVVHGINNERLTYDETVRLNRFKRDGYLFLPGLFHDAESSRMLTEAERLQATAERKPFEEAFFEKESGAVRSIFAAHRLSDLFAQVCEDYRLLSLARNILGEDVYVHQSRLNYKPAFTGKEFYWHSDFETWHAEDGMPRMRAISISLSLTPSYATNGPLMLIPGSQDIFVSCAGDTPPDHYRKSLVRQQIGTPDTESVTRLAKRRGIKAPTGAAGSVVAFDCNTMHASNSNITPFPRTNFFVVYNAISNKLQPPFAAIEPRPEFVAARKKTPTLPRRS